MTAVGQDAPTLTEFLLARIAEDERHVNGWCEDGDSACPERDHPGHVAEARTRAECEAKRRIVDEFGPSEDADGRVDMWSGNEIPLRHLAAVYADHPDYRPEWKP